MSRSIPVTLKRRVRQHFSNICAYCRTAEALTAMTFEFDHCFPRSLGGETLFENLCFACPSCNRVKGNRISFIDPESSDRVPLFHPHQQRWEKHFVWAEDGTIVLGTTAIGRASVVALQMNRSSIVRIRAMWVLYGEHPPNES
jgi:HNH endonuclease